MTLCCIQRHCPENQDTKAENLGSHCKSKDQNATVVNLIQIAMMIILPRDVNDLENVLRNQRFSISNETFCLFLGILLLCGCQKLPDRNIYWKKSPNTFAKAKTDSIATKSPSINKKDSRSFLP